MQIYKHYQQIEPPLRIINYVLMSAIVLVAAAVALLPLLPQAQLALAQSQDPTQGFVYIGRLAEAQVRTGKLNADDLLPPPTENRLVIPKISVDGQVYEGDENALALGIWRRPQSSTPPHGGNTVLVAHRFLYTNGPNTFYHLDKLNKGDFFIIYWQGQEYNYEVEEVKEVSPTATAVEENTTESRVTLYTCTPLWSSTRRLVVVGRLVS